MAFDGLDSGNSPLYGKLKPLMAALDRLDDTVETILEGRKRLDSMDGEVTDLMLDRSRLAQTLDKAEARASRLEDANKEVSRRLVKAMDTIRQVLESDDTSSQPTMMPQTRAGRSVPD